MYFYNTATTETAAEVELDDFSHIVMSIFQLIDVLDWYVFNQAYFNPHKLKNIEPAYSGKRTKYVPLSICAYKSDLEYNKTPK